MGCCGGGGCSVRSWASGFAYHTVTAGGKLMKARSVLMAGVVGVALLVAGACIGAEKAPVKPAAQKAAPHVRSVDFVMIFAAGLVFGVSFMGLIQAWKARGA